MYNDYQRLITKVATLYYVDDIPQNVIAKQLRLSKSKVCRLLAEAKQNGIVHTSVYSTNEHSRLESIFERRYGLQEAIITSEGTNPLDEVGTAGAEYMRRVIREGDIIGISWGKTLHSVTLHMSPFRAENVQVVQLVGGMDSVVNQVQSGKLAIQFAMTCGCSAQLLYCPARASTIDLKQSLMLDPSINQAFRLARSATIALVGIGAVSPTAELFQNGYLPLDLLKQLRDEGAVGDMCMRYFDERGIEADSSISDLTMSIELADLRNIPNVVAVAVGSEKGDAILGALKGGIVNTFITDKATADYVLSLDGVSPNEEDPIR